MKAARLAEASRQTLIDGNWVQMLVAIVLTGLFLGALSNTAPSTMQLASIGMACAIIIASVFFRRFEPRWDIAPVQAYAVLLVFVGLPMLLVGGAFGSWQTDGAPHEVARALAGLVAISTSAMVILRSRISSMLVAQAWVWSGSAIVAGEFQATLAICATLAIGFGLTLLAQRRDDERRQRQAELHKVQTRAEELLAEYETAGQGWFWETDRRGNITYVSPRIANLLAGDKDAMVGRPFSQLFKVDPESREGERTLNFHLSTRSSFQDLEMLGATDEAEKRWWSLSGRPVLDEFNNFMGFRGFGFDLTESKRSQQHVTQLARFDSLTKLANRFQVSEWLEKILSAPQQERRACAIFLLDLDRFKQVNDTLGHPVGDALLKQVAERLRNTVGKAGSVGRLGGDEFQVLLPGRHHKEDLANLAKRVIENLSQPYSIEGQRVIIGASVGISVCPAHGTTSEELIRNADLALYAAKDGGRGRHHFYATDLHSVAEERLQLEQELRDAVQHGQLELHYQPQVLTTTETITGFEALLRWNHPVHGYISPSKFVPIAEDAGLIEPIGEWALRTACDALARMPEAVRIAVNVSPLQFSNPALPTIVTNALANAGVNASRLELEITESVFINEDKSTEATFKSLKGIGVRLALDDFGTGYSSLGYLKKAPFDKIKIDQSFVRGATIEGSRNGALIASIVGLAEALGMETTAEGVETLDELDLVRSLGCSHVQGYIYEKPLPQEHALKRLGTGLKAIARGPKSARAPRQTMLRKVVLEQGGYRYDGTIRNISPQGALVEGLWNVPPGTRFDLHLADDYVIQATTRWSNQDRMGVEFGQALEVDDNNAVLFTPPRSGERRLLKKAG